jgi:hypothetical protein
MMDDLHSNDMRIIPVFVWNWTQFPSMTGESAAQMINDPESESYQLLTNYITEFVNRYKSHPALYFYELTNELNLQADLDVVGECVRDRTRPYGVCEPMSNFSTDQMIAFTSRLATFVRHLDPSHAISSGFSMPRPFAEHLRRQPEFSPHGPDYTADSLADFKKHVVDVHAGIDIVSVHFYNHYKYNERFRITGHTNAELLRIVKQTTDQIGKELFVGEFGDVDPHVKHDSNALFTQRVLDEIVELRIPYSAPWVWEFYQSTPYLTYDDPNTTFFNLEPGYTDLIISRIRAANQQLGNSIPSPQLPDTTPPQVIITWPLEGAPVSCAPASALIHAVASDNSGTISRVRFFIDGEVSATITKPPYQFSLDSTQLGLGKQQITAEAYDPSGNKGRYTTTFVSQKTIFEPLFPVCPA